MPRISRPELGALLDLRIGMIPESNQNRSGRKISPRFITIHNTSNANPGADAAAHTRFVTRTGFYTLASGRRNFVSWHFTVDDKEVVKHLPVNERAIHAGSGNGKSVAIEICMHQGIDQGAADLRAQRLVAVLMHDLKIPADHVKPHRHWTGKACPTLLLDDFDSFVDGARRIHESIDADPAPETDGGALLSQAEISAALDPRPEMDSEAEAAPEDDPTDAHDLIAQEVNKAVHAE